MGEYDELVSVMQSGRLNWMKHKVKRGKLYPLSDDDPGPIILAHAFYPELEIINGKLIISKMVHDEKEPLYEFSMSLGLEHALFNLEGAFDIKTGKKELPVVRFDREGSILHTELAVGYSDEDIVKALMDSADRKARFEIPDLERDLRRWQRFVTPKENEK